MADVPASAAAVDKNVDDAATQKGEDSLEEDATSASRKEDKTGSDEQEAANQNGDVEHEDEDEENEDGDEDYDSSEEEASGNVGLSYLLEDHDDEESEDEDFHESQEEDDEDDDPGKSPVLQLDFPCWPTKLILRFLDLYASIDRSSGADLQHRNPRVRRRRWHTRLFKCKA
ncbi:hypothetical protein PHSY_001305 [Pseudozyma hubeiensis SY62]|uniref:Uncharacterized protein n=1 Tax=Pseudozyma hubeiensis (strain SY62) TaxID=1305764 RepID=R9P6L9_PSEHS|nr:hypothetical protein PHSY_001305 [Pseudozyma hubeiensis SY62]GAC93740.1 hypothetical protein PHSY_001305 [Pseudozyma hubeiensis SY62]